MIDEGAPTTIALPDESAALVVNADGSHELYFPNLGDDEATNEVPPHCVLIAAFARALHSEPDIVAEMIKRFEDAVEAQRESE